MRIADVDFILIPEWLASGEPTTPANDDHWINRWQRNFATARWLDRSTVGATEALIAQSGAGNRPVVLVSHGAGVNVVLSASAALRETPVKGAFIVAPTLNSYGFQDVEEHVTRLPFRSVVVASDDHPDFTPACARQLTKRIGGHFVAAGSIKRIDEESGQGPWPEGLMRLGWFLKRIAAH